jgi:hypothetical protein
MNIETNRDALVNMQAFKIIKKILSVNNRKRKFVYITELHVSI